MDLTAVPGIGPEYRRRLHEAGVPDVAALAAVEDVLGLARRTGIAPARVSAFRASALDLTEDAGIAIDTPAPVQDAAVALQRALEGLRAGAAARARDLRAGVDRALGETAARAARGLRDLRAATANARGRRTA